MKNKKFICVLFFCSIVFYLPAYAKSPVWKISKDGNHLFLGGTIHILSKSDYPLPEAFEAAYSNSKLLVLETDLRKFQAPEFQLTLLQSNMYTGEQNIKQFLKPDTIKALETHLAAHLPTGGIPLENLSKFKPGLLSVTLTVLELQRLGLVGTGVDEFYNLRALNDKKEIRHLETVHDQIAFISKMGEGNEDEFIKYTLNDLKGLAKLFESMKKAWKNGDTVELEKVGLDPWKERFPKTYHSLLVERNNNWFQFVIASANVYGVTNGSETCEAKTISAILKVVFSHS